MATTLAALPEKISGGTTVTYIRSYADYPAPTWTLTLYLAGIGVDNFVAVASGSSFAVTLTAAETSALEAGNYKWAERVTNGSAVHDVASGVVVVEADIATAAAGELQSQEEKDLAVINDLFSGRLVKDMEAYQIAGRSVTRIPIQELRKMRAELRTAVWMQKNPGKFGRPVRVVFPKTGCEQT